jgi:hypothetical protein
MSMVTGINVGRVLTSLGEWRLQKMERPAGTTKQVALGRLRMPLWVYICWAVVLTTTFSVLANGAAKYVLYIAWVPPDGPPTRKPEFAEFDYPWFGVLVAMCIVDLIALVAGAVIRHKLQLRREQKRLEDVRNEKWYSEKVLLSSIV